ncbi:hypothetical protein L1887_09332 [Cichorium endivia]|nr:hypothetical protein L1887_09332 [Cichorium endivia]
MPPEPLPFDRKDLFKERKPSSSDPAGVVPVRWRETPTTPSSHHNNHGSFSLRCGGAGGSSDFRRPFSGHGKQVGGGWHVTTLEPWQDKFCRENNHINNGALASSSQKDRKGCNSPSPNGTSHLHSDFVNSWDELPPKDQHDKNNGSVVGTTGNQRLDNENSLGSSIDWKPLKWIRSGSLSSRGSGFSHSSSSKSIGVDSIDMKIDTVPGNTTPLQSPSEDAVPCLTPRTPADDVSSRKKPRLGWGEGLAKYEKKKVGPDDILDKEGVSRNGMVDGVSSLEPLVPSPCSQLDKSPSLTGCSECASPATPYSFACSSSPGIEEKASVKTAEADNNNNNCNPSTEGSTFNLENLELTEAVNMSSLLNELLQSDETNTQASGFVRSTAMDKLQVWKAEISRTLEITETEVDSLENELKSLVSNNGASYSLPTECNDLNTEQKSGPLSSSIISSTEKADDFIEEERTGVEDLDRESPGTATSKFVETFTSCDNNTPSDALEQKDSSCILDIRSEDTEAKSSQDGILSTVPVGGNVLHNKCGKLHELISVSNKSDANEARDELTNLLPSSQFCTKFPRSTNDSLVKKNFGIKKRFLKFKERAITLRFRAFQYLWKEDLRLLSVKKFSVKSHKKSESSSRMGFTDYQKHRSSIRSRFSSPAGNLSLVPTTELTDYANKLLSDSQIKICRNTLKMPSLILDKTERVGTRFISDNGLVENPCDVEKERSLVNFWTSEEKETFLENFSLFGKDFRKIASFLPRKTVADCVEFYYKNHKSDIFQKTKKHPEFAKQGKSCTTNTYLVTSGKRWSRDTNAASLDILGAASAMASANVDDGKKSQQKSTPKLYITTSRETAAADVLAGICGSISSEALSSCITSLVDSGDVYHHQHQDRIGGYSKRQLSLSRHETAYDVDEETCSDESCGGQVAPSDWTDEEKASFLQAVRLHGKDFTLISRFMKTRSRDECKVFYSKARKCLGLDGIHVETGNKDAVGPNHGGDGGSDHDDACMVDSGSVISCDKSSSEFKMEVEDLHSSDSKQEVAESHQIEVNEFREPEKANLEDTPQSDKVEVVVETVTKDLNSESCLDLSIEPCENSNLFPKDPIITSHRKTLSQDDISSRLSFRKSTSQRSSSTDGYHLHLPKHSLMDCVESSQVLKGYPVTNENLLPEHCLPRDSSLQICTQRQGSGSPSDVGKPGDVKLFGQILTNNPLSQSKVNASSQENGNARKSFNLKFDNNHGDDRNNVGLLDVPLKRSYGFWDGNRIQTGFPSLPDSSILLAKYPAAFGTHSSVKTGSNVVSGFQTRELYSYKTQEAVPPFTVDKLLMPRRNHSSESLSTLQQTGARAVVVGCNGVSDPVAAIRMHYAQTEQYKNGSNGDIGSR